MKLLLSSCLLFLFSLFCSGLCYANNIEVSIEPLGNTKFPAQMSVGEVATVNYVIENNSSLPITGFTIPTGIFKTHDSCETSPSAKNCQITLQFKAQYVSQHIQGVPEVKFGPNGVLSEKGQIDIIVIPGSDAQLGWDTIPTWSNMIEGSPAIDQIYIVRNNAQQTATIDSVDFDPGTDTRLKINSDTCSGMNLAQNQSCIIEVEANPSSTGSINEDLEVTYNGGTTTITTPINFAVNARGTLSWQITPTWQDMSKGDPEITQTYSIVNLGLTDVYINLVELEPDTDSRLEITGGTCSGTTLGQNDACTIIVKANPDSAGKVNEILKIDHQGSGSPLITPISFDVNNPRGNLIWDNSTPIVWNDMDIGDSPVIQTYIVKNNGGSDVTLGDIRENPDVQQVTILNTGTCQNGSLLAPNDTCTIDVEANATTVGPIAQNLEVDHNGAGLQLDQLIHFVVNSPGSALIWESPIPTWQDMIQGGPEVTQTYTLKNNGSVDVEITTVENLTNPNLSKENDQCSGQIITQNSTCTFDVRANPQTIGIVADTIQVNHNGSNSPLLRSINFTINAPGNLIWHSKPTNWPSLVVGQDDITQTYLVRNNGGSEVTIDDITFDPGSDTRVSKDGTCGTGDLDVNEICTIDVTISPTSTGPINQTLKVEYNNGASTLEDQFNLAVNEAGTLAWEGTNPIWNDASLNDPLIVQTYTVRNTGISDVTLNNIGFAEGGDPRLFIGGAAGFCKEGDVIAPNSTCTINILSNPNIAGQVYQTLQISHNGSGSPLEDIIEFGVPNTLCWGLNSFGQTTPPSAHFIQVDTGGFHSCGIKLDNTVVCWGVDFSGQATPPSGETFNELSTGIIHTCGIKLDKTLNCWGDDSHGQATPPIGTFIELSAGRNYNCAIRENDNTITCWGLPPNNFGQTIPPSGEFTHVSAGSTHTCAIKKLDSTITCWGSNFSGEIIAPSGTFIQLSAGSGHNCAIKSDNTPLCWGRGGLGATTIPPSVTTLTQINSEGFHSCGIKPDDTIVCWGFDNSGQATPPNKKFKSIDLGEETSCGILK